MSAVPAALERLVVERANGHCEYCGLAQEGQEATFHIDHVVPSAARGKTEAHNLALAGVSCSLRKGCRQRAVDPVTGTEVPLFNPRADQWQDHFYWEGIRVTGQSPVGRATIEALKMNRTAILAIRSEEGLRGRHPPTKANHEG